MQPRSPGQSGLGAFANAVGEGGQAAGRVLTNQQAEDAADLKERQIESENAYRQQEGQAALTNANAYSKAVQQNGTDKGGGMSSALRAQNAFRAWLAKPEDTTGVTVDPIVATIQRQFPDVKSKADLLSNPQAQTAALKLFSAQLAPTEEGDTSATPAPAAAPKPMMYKGRMIHVDPLKKQWVFEDGTPAQ